MNDVMLTPGVSPTGNLSNKLGRTKRNLSADTNDGWANVWHYLDQSEANGGPALAVTADIGDGTTNCKGVLAAASASTKPVRIPPGAYKVDASLMIATHVHFAPGAILKPASGVVVTLSSGYTADDTQQIFDVSLGGSFVIRNRAYLSVMHWGAKADYAYPSSGTDNSPALQACFATAGELAATDGRRILVTVPPGQYRIAAHHVLPNLVDLYMVGATLQYRGVDRSDAILTLGDGTFQQEQGNFEGISVYGWYLPIQPTIAEQDTFACVKIIATSNSKFSFDVVGNAAIGVLIEAARGKEVSYNTFHSIQPSTVKVGLELRGNYSIGYVNENDFFGANFTPSSSSNSLGAICGVKFSTNHEEATYDSASKTFTSVGHGLQNGDRGNIYSTIGSTGIPSGLNQNTAYFAVNVTPDTFQLAASYAGAAVVTTTDGDGVLVFHGYNGQNGNRFYGACFQVGDHPAAYTLAVSLVAVATERYANLTNGQEYYCDIAGTVATVPTHLSGSVTDSNGVKFTHVGPYQRVPVWFDRAGMANKFYGCRWEFGYGGFFKISQPATTATRIAANDAEVYFSDDNAKANPAVESFNDLTVNFPSYANRVKYYGQNDFTATALSAIHRRAIGSGSNLCVKGMFFRHPSWNTLHQYVSGTYVLCKDSLYSATFYDLCVAVDIAKHREVEVGFANAGVDSGRLRLCVAGENLSVIAVPNSADLSYGASDLTSFVDANFCWSSESDDIKHAYFQRNPDSAAAAYLIIGFSFNGNEISSVAVLPTDGVSPAVMLTPFESDSNMGGRFAYGTPTIGYFLSAGEYISNINTATSQPLGWVVKTAGILSPAWVTGVGVRKGELRMSDTNKIYAALSAGTTGATAPTGEVDVSDGSIVWEYVGIQAVLIATTQVF